MGGRRGSGRGRKRDSFSTSVESTWKRHDKAPVPRNSQYDIKALPENLSSQWDQPTGDWYGKADILSVINWDDSGVKEAWELAKERKCSTQSCLDLNPDLYIDNNIDWNTRTSCSVPESADVCNSIAEGKKGYIHENVATPPRPHSPVILGIPEVNSMASMNGWEGNLPVVPSGWENHVVHCDGWGSIDPQPPDMLPKTDNWGWEPLPVPEPVTNQAVSLAAHEGWNNDGGIQMACQTMWTNDGMEGKAGSRLNDRALPFGHISGWGSGAVNECLSPTTTQPPIAAEAAQVAAWGNNFQENRGTAHVYGWDDYPCYTDVVPQEDSNVPQTAGCPSYTTNNLYHGSGKVHVDNSQRASYTEAPELLQARRQNPRSFPKHSTCQQGQNSNMHLSSAKQWGTKQVWGMPPTFFHATKLY
ncbi:unnamed protein product [Sphagnum jensenii]|uniref:Uncharacterized protein n=1 Tax=Sphagnum jensenii TaxID=128206 RepID=A0ABP0XEA4_9BRYO